MTSSFQRLARLEAALLRPTVLSPEEEGKCLYRWTVKIENGEPASPSDIDHCADALNTVRYQLVRLADEMSNKVAAGETVVIRSLVDWAARVLQVPPDEPVPDFVIEALTQQFETVWDPASYSTPRIWQASRCLTTVALGTPDAREFRENIADGDFDAKRQRDGRLHLNHGEAHLVFCGLSNLSHSDRAYTTYDGQLVDPRNTETDGQPVTRFTSIMDMDLTGIIK